MIELFLPTVLTLLAAPTPAQSPVPAPDGQRGLGAESSLQDVLRPFRQPSEDDEAFLRGLTDLEGEVRTLVTGLERSYDERGLLDVLDLREPTLDALHEELERFLTAPGPKLASKRGKIWAELFLDTRLRVRAWLLSGWGEDARELRQALTLLRANDDGWVRFVEPEAQLVAKRADLAAAFLRARIQDLEALREEAGASEVAQEEIARVVELARAAARDDEAQAALDREVLARERRDDATIGLLFTARLAEEAGALLDWRTRANARADQLRQEVRTWRPDTDEGKDAPPAVRARKKTDRRRAAFQLALEGLANDPFDSELTYAVGRMAEYVSGRQTSADYYDRFLALRGIRSHDDKNWRKRDLTDEEKHALFQVQQYATDVLSGQEPPP